MKRLIAGTLATALALVLAGTGAAFAGGRTAGGAELGVQYVAGPAKAVDPLNDVMVDVPKGWYAIVPTGGISGVTTLANYDMNHAVELLPDRSNHVLYKDMAKVDLMTFDLGTAGSVEAWMDRRFAGDGNADDAVSASRKVAIEASGLKGRATVLRLGPASRVEIVLPWGEGKVLLATIAPLDTTGLDAALAAIDTVRTRDSVERPRNQGAGSAQNVRNDFRSRLAAPVRSLVRGELARTETPGELPNASAAAGACTSWTGSDSGNCGTGMSCATTASVTLYLPFQWQTYWMAGGVGSFYGNYYHGNCNSDYYAIDFNRYSSGTCSTPAASTGQNVYAAAAGTATVPATDPTGYGKYVIVTHSNGYKSYYAHLSSINVTNNQAVTTQTVVGLVGDSGSAAGAPHLHFAYKNGSKQSYCNKSGGCPNGEAAKSPQTQRPSPMTTNLGSLHMYDGNCYQGPP